MNKELTIGVLNIQGDIEENIDACKKAFIEMGIDGQVIPIKDFIKIEKLDGLIIPGGESTVMGLLLAVEKLNLENLRKKIEEGLPVLGTCAGMIILSSQVQDKTLGKTKQELLKNLDISIERNAFGRQHESFEVDLDIPVLGDKPFRSIFIRGPIVKEIGNDVKILATLDNKIVAVQQNNIIATSFHPEIAEDHRFHIFFINLILKNKNHKKDIKNIQ